VETGRLFEGRERGARLRRDLGQAQGGRELELVNPRAGGGERGEAPGRALELHRRVADVVADAEIAADAPFASAGPVPTRSARRAGTEDECRCASKNAAVSAILSRKQ
jgi:hypothetical protein